jgi:hypothetical protein
VKLLAAGRVDNYSVRASNADVKTFCEEANYLAYIETSARGDVGIDQLRKMVVEGISWDLLDQRVSPLVFQRLRQAIAELKDTGRTLIRLKDLRDGLPSYVGQFDDADLQTVVDQLSAPGAVIRLMFGDYLLLRPELLNTYAQAVILTLREDPLERGTIAEERVLRGELNYPAGFRRVDPADESVVLRAMVLELVRQRICLRDDDPDGARATQLVFPAYFRRERPPRPNEPNVTVSYSFTGDAATLYTKLVVRLSRSDILSAAVLYADAADFTTPSGLTIGVRISRTDRRIGQLDIYADAKTDETTSLVVSRYVDEIIRTQATKVERIRTYRCSTCGPISTSSTQARLSKGHQDILCNLCETERVELFDALEMRFGSPEIDEIVQRTLNYEQQELDTESRERVLVGEMTSIVANAKQIAREITVGDHGIDMEIEFKSDGGQATGKKVLLQLKSGDSHLRRRKRSDIEVFTVTDRHAEYWMSQAHPVMLVVRASGGMIRWMDISAALRTQRTKGNWPPKQVEFVGGQCDVGAILEWRRCALRT